LAAESLRHGRVRVRRRLLGRPRMAPPGFGPGMPRSRRGGMPFPHGAVITAKTGPRPPTMAAPTPRTSEHRRHPEPGSAYDGGTTFEQCR